MRETVVIATGNKKKLKEIQELLIDLPYTIKTMEEVGLGELTIIEDGKTFEENALIKARTVMKKTGFITIADDSGLEVLVLNNQPGIYSARYAGEEGNDKKNNEKLLRELMGIPIEKRDAKFVCTIAVVSPHGKEALVRGECEGKIAFEEKGNNGFGYDPLFIVPEYNLTFAELDPYIKNNLSHRGKALKQLPKAMEILRSE